MNLDPTEMRNRKVPQTMLTFLLTLVMVCTSITPALAQTRISGRADGSASATPNVLQLNETFNAALAVPTGWRVVNNKGTAGWVVEADVGGGNEAQNKNDTGGTANFAVADSDESRSEMDTELRSSTLNLATAQSVRLKFKTRFEDYTPAGDTRVEKADVDVSSDGGTTWQTVWNKRADYKGSETVDISTQAAGQQNVIIRFRYYDANYDYFWKIDDVQIDATTAGPTAPSAITATADGQTRIKLPWPENSTNETGFKIERSLNGTDGWAEIRKVAADVSQHNDTNLICGTTYHYRVSAVNTAGASTAVVTNAKTANCPATTVTQINEAFTATTLPTGWTLVQNKGNEPWRFDNIYNRANETGGAGGAALADSDRGNNPGLDMDAELRTPILNFAGKNAVQLEFRSKSVIASCCPTTISAAVSKDGGTIWTEVWKSTQAHSRELIKVDISQQAANQATVMVRFRYIANDSYYWQIDDVKIAPLPLPAAPTALNVTLGGNSEPILAWTANGAQAFEIWRSATANDNGTKIADVANGTSTHVDNSAASNNTYHYRVRAKNAAGTSAYSNVVQSQVGDRSIRFFDLKISHYGNPSTANRQKVEENIRFFADALYEMSNGVHRLRRIEIFGNGAAADVADIRWSQNCHPKATTSGFGKKNQYITMCDLSPATPGNPISQDYLANPKLGGWGSLGHEWGHYAYGLLDEYQYAPRTCDFVTLPFKPCKDDVAPVPSIMNSGDTAAIRNDISWLNFSYRGNNSGKTAHHRLYGVSAWETLARPPQQDPRDGQRNNYPTRRHYPELARVAPANNAVPSRELDKANQARAALAIVWMGGGGTVTAANSTVLQQNTTGALRQLVIDRSSATTSPAQLAATKEALHQFIDRLRFGDSVGIITYDSSATTIVPITTIDSPATRESIHTAITGVTLGDDKSATGGALQAALEGMKALGDLRSFAKAVYLIGRGQTTAGDYPTLCIPQYQDAFVPVYTFYTGTTNSSNDGVVMLQRFSELTNGRHSSVGSNRSALNSALTQADSRISPTVDLAIKEGYAFVDPNERVDLPIQVDASLAYLEIEVDWFGTPDWAAATLIAPDGSATDIASCQLIGDAAIVKDQQTICFATVDAPQTGTWTLQVRATPENEESLDLFYWTGASATAGVDTIHAAVESTSGERITYPEPIVINAYLEHRGGFLATALLTATVDKPDGSYVDITLRDDGVNPDATAGDGMYAGIFAPVFDGTYHVALAASNNNGNAQVSFTGLEDADSLEPLAMSEAFDRAAYMEVAVVGAPAQVTTGTGESSPAVALRTDNSAVAGRINGADDFTVYAVDVPNDYSGELILRVDNLGLGMDPYIVIYNEAETWERDAYLEIEPTTDDFLAMELFATPGEQIFVEVFHYNEQAEQGTYDISIGPRLVSDNAVLATGQDAVKQANTMYLPIVQR